jgi:plasmid stabilization system protein ParE
VARGLIWTDPVLEDIEELASTLERYSSAYSVTVVRALRKQAERLPLFPFSGRIVPEWGNPAYREVIVFRRYRLIYRLEPEVVIIETVQDTRIPLPGWH